MTDREPIDVAAVLDRVDLVKVIEARGVALTRAGRHMVGRCPFHQEKSGSFTVFREPAPGHFHCFGCGEHGDAIAFVMRNDKVTFLESVEKLGGPQVQTEADRRRLARQKADDERREARSREAKAANAGGIWCGAGPADGSPVEHYLRGRAIDLDALSEVGGGGIPSVLRFGLVPYYWEDDRVPPDAPRGERFKVLAVLPAMVAAVQGPDDKLAAVHLTFLQQRPEGAGGSNWVKAEPVHPLTGEILPAKKILGKYFGGAIRLTPPGPTMRAGEGIETSLTVLAALRRAGRGEAVWALASRGNFTGAGLGHGPRKPGTRAVLPDGRVRWQRRSSPIPDPARPGFIPPRGVTRFGWLGDADDKDPEDGRLLVERGLARYRALGIDAFATWATPGSDFNDMARGAK